MSIGEHNGPDGRARSLLALRLMSFIALLWTIACALEAAVWLKH